MAISLEDQELLMHAKSVANVRCNNLLSDINVKIKGALKDVPSDKLNLSIAFAFTREGTKRVVFESDNEVIKSKMLDATDSLNNALKEFHDCGIDMVLKLGTAPDFLLTSSTVSILCWTEDVKNGDIAELMKDTFNSMGPIKVES